MQTVGHVPVKNIIQVSLFCTSENENINVSQKCMIVRVHYNKSWNPHC